MSLWRRLFGRDESVPEVDVAAPEPPPEPPREPAPLPKGDPEALLDRLGEGGELLADDDAILAAIDALAQKGREARAIDLARRVLFHHPDRRRVHQRVAELLASRGDDEGAARLLEPFVDRPEATLELWMLAAEIAERRGDSTRALALYERVVARDLDYPRAWARVRRLREGDRAPAELGATLMVDGALTRGRYRVTRELGRGGAGTVFLAADLSLGRDVALKVYHRRGRAERTRLIVEGRTAARLEHPGVVRVFDVDESLAAIAMEHVLGGSVRGELKKGRVAPPRVVRWAQTSADALAYIHAAGVVHRDFKPSNMLLRADERVVLTDFGVACRAGEQPAAGQGAGEGTLAYMPSEQRAGAPASGSMDVYAFGASLKEILEHAASEPPHELQELALACMRADPKQRPTAAWLADQLRAL